MYNLTILGLIFTSLGALILLLNSLFTGEHQITHTNPWSKRYWWKGLRPFYKDTKTLKWRINRNRWIIVEWFLPPKYLWEIVGFFCILIGTILQIIGLY